MITVNGRPFDLGKIKRQKYQELVGRLMIATDNFSKEGKIEVSEEDLSYAQAVDAMAKKVPPDDGDIFALLIHINIMINVGFDRDSPNNYVIREMGFGLSLHNLEYLCFEKL